LLLRQRAAIHSPDGLMLENLNEHFLSSIECALH
jgi:hypothetical protein